MDENEGAPGGFGGGLPTAGCSTASRGASWVVGENHTTAPRGGGSMIMIQQSAAQQQEHSGPQYAGGAPAQYAYAAPAAQYAAGGYNVAPAAAQYGAAPAAQYAAGYNVAPAAQYAARAAPYAAGYNVAPTAQYVAQGAQYAAPAAQYAAGYNHVAPPQYAAPQHQQHQQPPQRAGQLNIQQLQLFSLSHEHHAAVIGEEALRKLSEAIVRAKAASEHQAPWEQVRRPPAASDTRIMAKKNSVFFGEELREGGSTERTEETRGSFAFMLPERSDHLHGASKEPVEGGPSPHPEELSRPPGTLGALEQEAAKLRKSGASHEEPPPTTTKPRLLAPAYQPPNEKPFVFCSFNNVAKLQKSLLDDWIEILQKTGPKVRLAIKGRNFVDRTSRIQWLQATKVPEELWPRIDLWITSATTKKHMEVYRCADMALDSGFGEGRGGYHHDRLCLYWNEKRCISRAPL